MIYKYGKMILRGDDMLYISMGALERCACDKEKITIICPSIWIHYVVGGRGYYNGEAVTAGQAFIVYKNDICEYFPDKEDPWTYVWIRLEGDDDEKLLQRCGLPHLSSVFSFSYTERIVSLAEVTFDGELLALSSRIYGEAVAKMILSLHGDGRDVAPYVKDVGWVDRAKDYIAANYHRRLKVEDIAEALYIDRQYLRNLFVKHMGISTKAYLDNYRMMRAAELLELKERSVYIVALSVGYTDALAFSKAFRKHFGMPPSKYASRIK